MNIDFKAQGIKSQDRALASLSILAKLNKVISLEMLQSALKVRFKEPALSISLDLVDQVETDSQDIDVSCLFMLKIIRFQNHAGLRYSSAKFIFC